MKTKIAAVVALSAAVLAGCATQSHVPAAPRTTLLVVNQGSKTLSFVDEQTLAVTKTVELPAVPHEIAATPDGRTAFVTIYGNKEVVGNSISVIDVAARAERTRITIGGDHKRPHGIAWRDGAVFVTAEMSRAVLRVDPATGTIQWSGDTGAPGSHMLALSPDGKRIYTGNMGSSNVSIISTGGEAVTHVPVGKGPEGIALTPDGSELWVAHRGEGGLSVIDTSSAKVVASLAPGVVSARVAITPDARKVLLFDMPSGNVVVYDRASRTELGRIAVDGMPGGGIVAPDSRTAYVSVYQPFSVARIDLETMKVTGRVETGIAPDGMALVRG